MKISSINTGNTILDSKCYTIITNVMRSHYESERKDAVDAIKSIINEYPSHKERIIERINFNLSEFIDEQKEKIKNKDVTSDAGAQSISNTINGIQYFLTWITGLSEYSENEAPENIINTQLNSNVKITWNEQSNVLTDVFRQLKNIYNKNKEPLISNSYEELAVFLQNNFSVFSDTKLSTITTQLKNKNTKPKTNRVIEILQTKE